MEIVKGVDVTEYLEDAVDLLTQTERLDRIIVMQKDLIADQEEFIKILKERQKNETV
jgi:hypothetical protein